MKLKRLYQKDEVYIFTEDERPEEYKILISNLDIIDTIRDKEERLLQYKDYCSFLAKQLNTPNIIAIGVAINFTGVAIIEFDKLRDGNSYDTHLDVENNKWYIEVEED